MKKRIFIFLIVSLVAIDILISLAINADLLSQETRLAQLRQEVRVLRQKHQALSREVARLGSLQRIARVAQERGFKRNQERIVVMWPSQLVRR